MKMATATLYSVLEVQRAVKVVLRSYRRVARSIAPESPADADPHDTIESDAIGEYARSALSQLVVPGFLWPGNASSWIGCAGAIPIFDAATRNHISRRAAGFME